jgi:hypothetical protein
VTDEAAYNAVVDVSCTERLPSLSFWDSCVYTRDPAPQGVVSERAEDLGHMCMCNVVDAKGVTNHYLPVTAKCGLVFLCHNSAPLKRRAVSYEQVETPIELPHSISTAVTPLIPIMTEATPGSLPIANSGPTNAPTSRLMPERWVGWLGVPKNPCT